MTVNTALALKSRAYNFNREMGLSTGAGTGMASVLMGIVSHHKMRRRKALTQFGFNPVADFRLAYRHGS